MVMITLTIDGQIIQAKKDTPLLLAAQAAGIYIPRLCHHPYLLLDKTIKPQEKVFRGTEIIQGDADAPGHEFEGCGLCAVAVQGKEDYPLACETKVEAGMVVDTKAEGARRLRRDRLSAILATHPHVCLTCAQAQGCPRTQCSVNVPEAERCCPLLGNCELQKVAAYISIKPETTKYIPRGLPVIKDQPLFDFDYNLCIGCLRCVRVCHQVRGVEVLDYTYKDGRVVVGLGAESLLTSCCRFCGACVEVCPTGTLMDKPGAFRERQAALLPCQAACPAGIDIPRYVRLIAEGRYPEALAVVREKVPFPEILGRVCFHPCEEVCRRGSVNEPVAICSLKWFAAGQDNGSWKEKIAKASPRGKKVAIVGSGPTGLTAAYYLALQGHQVTVYDGAPGAGGMMRYGIPAYRLAREVLDRELQAIKDLGVEFRLNSTISKDMTRESLKASGYDAAFLAVGLQKGKSLKIEGADLPEVLIGLDFLRRIANGQKVAMKNKVAVVGGGNVAVDVALSAKRLGAKEVRMVCLEKPEEMPAHPWELQTAREEGIIIENSWGPRKILAANGSVAGLELIRCAAVFNSEGKFAPVYDASQTRNLEADMVLWAVGQALETSLIPATIPLLQNNDKIIVEEATLATNLPGFFAGGEAVSGPASVIDAVAYGRRAAASMDKYLGGKGKIEQILVDKKEPSPCIGKIEGFGGLARAAMPSRSPAERQGDFGPIELGFNQEQAGYEARRCLQCDLRLLIPEPALPPEPWLLFSPENIALVPAEEGVVQVLDENKVALLIAGRPNMQEALEEQLNNEKAKFFIYEADKMYTQRESELIQQFLQLHGKLPEGNDLGDDLF